MAVVGMASFFGASVRAPMTGMVLVLEMTASTAAIVPILAATASAVLVAYLVGSRPSMTACASAACRSTDAFSELSATIPEIDGRLTDAAKLVSNLRPGVEVGRRLLTHLFLGRPFREVKKSLTSGWVNRYADVASDTRHHPGQVG